MHAHHPSGLTAGPVGDVIQINVGGVVHMTTRGRLLGASGSTLQRLVQEWSPVDPEGRLFIDRDGDIFRYILDHLRDRNFPLPDDMSVLKRLACEACYFGLPALVESIETRLGQRRRGSHSTDPRLVEVRRYDTGNGVAEILLMPPVPSMTCLEPLYPSFDKVPVSPESHMREMDRMYAVKHAETVMQVASALHEQAGYRVRFYGPSGVMMERDDWAFVEAERMDQVTRFVGQVMDSDDS